MLRRAGEAKSAETRRVTLGDLANGTPVLEEGETPRFSTIGVRRAGKRDDVSVPIEDANSTIGAAARGRGAR
jgi:hypothetical protein